MAGLALKRFVGAGVASMALVLLEGCGGDDNNNTTPRDSGTTDSPIADSPSGDTGTVPAAIVTATYQGTKSGPLIVAFFTSYPPPPNTLPSAFASNEKPTWPGSNQVTLPFK